MDSDKQHEELNLKSTSSDPQTQEQGNSTAPTQEGEYTSAPVQKRFIAALLDHVAAWTIAFLLALLLFQTGTHYVMAGHSFVADENFRDSSILWLAIPYVIAVMSFPILYFAFFESSKFQATPGKRLMGIEVAGAKKWKIGFGRSLIKAIIQTVVMYLCSLIAFFLLAFLSAQLNYYGSLRWIVYLCEGLALAFLFCIPVFKSKQAIIDKICGRLVINASPAAQKKDGKGSTFGAITFGISLLALIAGLFILIPDNFIFYKQSKEAMSIAENGFVLKAQGKEEEGTKLLEQANNQTHLAVPYLYLSSWYPLFGLNDQGLACKEKSLYFLSLDQKKIDAKQKEEEKTHPRRRAPGEI